MNRLRWTAAVLTCSLGAGVAGCGGPRINAAPPAQSPYRAPAPPVRPAARPGMSTQKKVLLLAGAAAVWYLYNKHKNRQGQGAEGRYFRSKNGRVYYREMKTGKFHWVDPPKQPIQVPANEFERYTGRDADQFGASGGVVRKAPAEWSNPNYR